MSENNSTTKNLVAKTLFVVGIIVVIMILAFAIIKIVPRLFSSFATVGDAVRSPIRSNNDLQVEGPDSLVNSGETTLLRWDYEPIRGGSYEIDYECSEYLELVMGTREGNKTLECETIYKIAPTAQSISLIPTLSRENILVDIPFNIRYVDSDGEILVRDSLEFTVRNQRAEDLAGTGSIIDTEVINPGSVEDNRNTQNTNQPTNNNTQNTQPTTYTPTYSGLPDLAISNLISIDEAVVAFTVSNIGSDTSGVWFFSYRMPDGDTQISPSQRSLFPGQAVRFTLRFEDIPDGQVVISVDPYNAVYENTNANNIAATYVEGDNGSGNSDYNDDDEADLEIDDLEVGRMSGSRFIEDDRIDEDDDAAVRFTVTNRGGEDTGRWKFTVDPTPYDDEDEYESGNQRSLDPGESVTIVVEFENPDEGNYDIEVEVDSDDDVDEEDERNNDASEELEVERD